MLIFTGSSILNLWQIAENGTANTAGLQNYWQNALIAIPMWNSGTYEPGVVWGPHPSYSTMGFKVYSNINVQGGGPGTFGLSETINDAEVYHWRHEGLEWNGSWMVYYKVTAFNSEDESDSTNIASITASGFYKEPAEINKLQYSLSQNYPNPFNPSTTILFSIPKEEIVQIKLYDILGKEVSTLVNQKFQPGNYEVEFNAKNLASGIYFYRIIAGKYMAVKKLQLLK